MIDDERESGERLDVSVSPSSGKKEAQSYPWLSNNPALPNLARLAVETFVLEGRIIKPPPALGSSLLSQEAACFVSIKTDHQELRGCIGTIEPTKRTLAEELITNAISAAIRDPRFSPIAEIELIYLHYSVDILYKPELALFEDLDPATYGVIVEDQSRSRRGLLLPHLEGVVTAQQQIQIAVSKAGIPTNSLIKIYRFRVQRFQESSTLI
ncbi:MAG: AmmeMemoRadiSam system protein A [Acidobacteria bacterium]|nr:AmmeMemoRadiSam system protein A [Acidobacteriota bacterium]